MNARTSPRLPAGLYALCDDAVRSELGLASKARALLAGGCKVLQLRIKVTPAREALRLSREVVSGCRDAGAVCLINDRVDLALLSNAHGVHLGDEDLPVADARRVLGPGAVIGRTVRSGPDAVAAALAGADYVGVGPLFPTRTKQVQAEVLGLRRFAQVVGESPVPVVGIAGIGLSNIAQVAGAGAHGAAVLSDLLLADDIADRTRRLSAAFEQGRLRRTLGA